MLVTVVVTTSGSVGYRGREHGEYGAYQGVSSLYSFVSKEAIYLGFMVIYISK